MGSEPSEVNARKMEFKTETNGARLFFGITNGALLHFLETNQEIRGGGMRYRAIARFAKERTAMRFSAR